MAYAKWNELKPVLLNKEVKLSTRIRFLEAYIRSRLVYSVQACATHCKGNEEDGNSFLRRIVRGGFERKNVPKSNDDIIPPEEIDWAYKINDKELFEITKTTELKHFCEIQYLKYVAHIERSGNYSLQKQLLCCETAGNRWRRKASYIGVDEA